MIPRAAALLLALALLSPSPAAAAPAGGPPEMRFLEEEDEAKAAKLLDTLIDKYDTPRECAALVKMLRTKRTFAGGKDRETREFPCADGKTRQWTWILPPKHNPAKPAGVLFWLHGAIRQPAPGGGAGEADMFRPAVKDLGLIVVGPSTFGGVEWGTTACRGLVRHALRTLKVLFNVDENRVYMCGDSDGGRGAYNLCETEAGSLAASVPVIGSPGGVTRYLNLRNLPFFAINGEKDSIFTLDHVKESVEGMKASGIDLTWKLVEGGGHDPRFFLKHGEEVRKFLEGKVREPFPKKVEWCIDPSREDPGFPADTFRWIRIEEAGAAEHEAAFEGDGPLVDGSLPRVEGTRDGNRIALRTRGVKRVTLLLSDGMVDLGKEVEISVNGRVLHRGTVEADARAILEEARRFLDRQLVFSARVTLAVDGEEAK